MDGINEFSSLYCSAEWHIEQLDSRLASSIYNLAFRVAAKSGRFSASIPHLATYFHAHERTVGRAIRGLKGIELFNLLSCEWGHHPCVYQPVRHADWARTHPGKCLEKLTLPYTADGDLLGRALFAECDGRVKFFYPNVLKGMRNTGLSDLQIVAAMKEFREMDPVGISPGFVGRFMKYLKKCSQGGT